MRHAGLQAQASSVVKPPRIAESPVSLECKEWGTLQIGDNRVVIGLVKRPHLREDLVDPEKKRVNSERLFLIGRWTEQDADRHVARYGREFLPITVEEHLAALTQTGFSVVEIFWYSQMQAGFFPIR